MNALTTSPSFSVWARHGMVSSGHSLASQAGLHILQSGGSAADAAIAMALATAVVMPDMCGLGGEAFALYRTPRESVVAYQGSGRLPQNFDSSLLKPSLLTLPLYGGASVSVPGAVDLYLTLHQAHGRLPLDQVAEPAISLAREGFLVDARLAESLLESQSLISGDPQVAARFYPQGESLGEGALLVQSEMAEAFEMIVKKGRPGFYQGPLAESMINAVKAAGGYLSAEDLAAHRTEVVVPISLQIGSLTVHQTPPPSQGVVMLEALNLLSRLPIDAHWRDDSRLVHQVVQALRWSFYDRRTYLGDPAWVDFDARTLLTEKWRESRQSALLEHRDIPTTLSQGDTTSFVAVDRDGNAVSFIHSLALQFGSGVFVPQGGFFLNNRSGRSFNTIPGHPNQAQPGKRPMHTLNTYMVTKDDVLEIVGNTPGGDGQPQWNTTILLDLIYGERLPHQAVGLPRFTMAPATDVHNLSQPYLLQMESRFSPQVIQDLEEQGHRVQVIGPYAGGGSAQVIRQREHGLVGASDPRGIGQTLGY